MNQLLSMSATQLANLIKNQDISSQDIIKIHIEQIKKVNPFLNAIVKDRFNEALNEASAADNLVKSSKDENDLPLFLGVPCTIKESFALKGMPNTSGLISRKGVIPDYDAITVKRVRDAGFIPLGVTNTSELCLWMETNNTVYGRTNNAYDQNRTAGGSSGGEGAIVGSGGSPFGLGSDIGGSIRSPAFFNGVFGHKPSGGLVPSTGQFPISENKIALYSTSGPICRKAEDLMPILKILSGPDGVDSECKNMEIGSIQDVKIENLTIIDIPDNSKTKVCKDLRDVQKKCILELESKGAKVKAASIDKLKDSFHIWLSMIDVELSKSYSSQIGFLSPFQTALELLKFILGKSNHTLPAILFSLIEYLPSTKINYYIELGNELRNELINLIGKDGILIFPSYSVPAPKHNLPIIYYDHWVYTGIYNVLEFPGTQIPMGVNKENIPLGVQILSIPGNDHKTIAVALELEKIFGGWRPPWELGLSAYK